MRASVRHRSLLASVGTGSLEIAAFAVCTAVLPAAWLVVARWVVGALGSTTNYFVSRRWVFARRDVRKRRQGLRFALATLTSITLATGAWAVLARAGLDPRLAHVASMAAVWLAFTFPVLRLWVFRAPVSQTV